jgi:hypothetical protein
MVLIYSVCVVICFRYGTVLVNVVVKKERQREMPRQMGFKQFLNEFLYEDLYLINDVPYEMMADFPVSLQLLKVIAHKLSFLFCITSVAMSLFSSILPVISAGCFRSRQRNARRANFLSAGVFVRSVLSMQSACIKSCGVF